MPTMRETDRPIVQHILWELRREIGGRVMDLIDRQQATDKIIARYPDSEATEYCIGYADAINDVFKDIRFGG